MFIARIPKPRSVYTRSIMNDRCIKEEDLSQWAGETLCVYRDRDKIQAETRDRDAEAETKQW